MKKRIISLLIFITMLTSFWPVSLAENEASTNNMDISGHVLTSEYVDGNMIQRDELIDSDQSEQQSIEETGVNNITLMSTTASGTCGDDLTWALDSGGTLTIKGNGNMYDWEWRERVCTSPWDNYRSEITDVIIGDGVTDIGDYAFFGCYNILRVTIPDSVTTIGKSSFDNCTALESIDLSNNITSMGEQAFAFCSNLKNISIPKGMTVISDETFRNCLNLANIEISDNITSIGEFAFAYCESLIAIDIPNSVANIGNYAFSHCSVLENASIFNKTVTINGNRVFDGCSAYFIIYGYTGSTAQNYAERYQISFSTLNNTGMSGMCGDNVNWVFTSDGLLYIYGTGDMYKYTSSNHAPWYSCRNSIKNVIIADGINNIGDYSFYRCTGLKSIGIPNSIQGIGEYAFYNCRDVTDIKLPYGITSIENETFCFCESMINIEIPDSLTTIGRSAFEGCNSLKNIKIPNGVKKIDSFAFAECRSIIDVKIPNSVTNIGVGAFYYCEGIKTISIPSGIENIASKTFCNCSSLSSLEIPDSVTSIGEWAFGHCYSIEHINVPDTITDIDQYAFYRCTSLSDIEIPSGITKINRYTFYECTSLTSIALPNSVKDIEYYAFSGCDHIVDIYYRGRPLQWSNISIYSLGNDNIKNATVRYLLDDTAFTVPTTDSYTTTYGGECHYWEFTPTISGVYFFESTVSSGDTYGYLYDSGFNLITYNDDGGEGSNFKISYELTAGTTYYYGAKWHNPSVTGDINVKLSKYTPEAVSTPAITISNIIGGKSASISCATSGATIYYTTNGSTPTTSSNKYTGAISLTTVGTTTVKAIAVASGYTNSDIAINSISISKTSTPTASKASGTITGSTSITLSSSTSGATIYYTTNGNTPTTSNNKYTGTITVNSTTTLKAIAVVNGYVNSDVATYTYTKVAPKTFTMLRDNYSFANTWSSFDYGNSYHIPLARYISVFGITEGTQRYNSDGAWGGSCYGFSTTSSLFFENKLSHNQYDSSATSLFEIPAPKTPKANLTILMERYQIAYSLYSVSSERNEHWGRMDKIIQAVKHFEETGEDPIVLCMWQNPQIGHAVVPYKCVSNSDGSYSVYVYDNNYPTSTSRVVNINKNMTEFDYYGYRYLITFDYAETVYNALQGGISLFSTDSAEEKVATLTVNSEDVKITDLNGVSIENIDGAYEILPLDMESDSVQKTYIIPNGDYIVENYSTNIDELQISISNNKDYQVVKTDDIKAIASVGVYADTDRVYAYVSSTKTSNMSIKTLNNSGISKLFETVGKSFGATAESSASVAVVADSSVTVNGTTVKVGNPGEVGSTSISTLADVNGPGSGRDFETVTSKNSLTYSDGTVSGKLSYLIYNNTQSLTEARIIVGLYSDDGQLVSIIINDDEVLALGSNYIDLGTLNYFGLDKSGYKIKCFVWDSLDNMQPLAEAVETDID